MKTLKFVLAVVLVVAATPAAFAQKSAAPDLDAARNLMKSLQMEQTWNATVHAITEQVSQGNEELKAPLTEFYARVMSYQEMEPKFAALYAKFFTSSELADLLAFYQSPTGRKALRQLPQITAESMKIAQEVMAAHQDEIKELVAKAVKQAEAKKKSESN